MEMFYSSLLQEKLSQSMNVRPKDSHLSHLSVDWAISS